MPGFMSRVAKKIGTGIKENQKDKLVGRGVAAFKSYQGTKKAKGALNSGGNIQSKGPTQAFGASTTIPKLASTSQQQAAGGMGTAGKWTKAKSGGLGGFGSY
jgi:hypothetical protein